MNHLILASLLLSCSVCALAQSVALPVERVGFGERELASKVWNAGAQNTVAEGCRNFVVRNDSGFVTEYFYGDASHYLFKGDVMHFRGYTVGRNVGALADSACAVLRFPLAVGDSLSCAVSLKGAVDGSSNELTVVTEGLVHGNYLLVVSVTATETVTKKYQYPL